MTRTERVALGFAYFFLTMTGYYILKPVRESFFLGEKGFGNLPKAHLLVMTTTFFTVLVYTRLTRKLGVARLVIVANFFFLVCIAAFWATLYRFDSPEIRSSFAWVYYCWVSLFAVFAVTMFWSVVHTIFTSQDGSKCYGIIGAGGTLGALAGGWLTNRLATVVGTENLLLLAMAALSPCLVLGYLLVKQSAAVTARSTGSADSNMEVTPSNQSESIGQRSTFDIFRSSSFLCVLGLIVMLTIVISVFDEYRYGKIIQDNFVGDNDGRTAFFGKIFLWTNCIGLFFSVVLTGWVQSRFGPRPGITMYAVVVLIASIAFLGGSSLELVFYSAVAVQSVAYSIYQWSRELLYTATTAEEKLIAKGFIDTFLFRAGAGTAALSLLAIGKWDLLSNPARQISFIVLPLILTLAALGWWISAEFKRLKA